MLGLLYARKTERNPAGWGALFEEFCAIDAGQPAASVASAISNFEPDVIYLHNLESLAAVEELLNSGTPVVRMVHDHSLYCLRTYKYNYFTRKPCTRAFSAHCVFPCLATVARNRGGSFPVRWASYREKRKELQLNRKCRHLMVYSDYCRQELVRNGFDPDRITLHVPIRDAGKPCVSSSFAERNLVLFTGQILRGKGVDLLLRALAKVHAPFECLVFGDGSSRQACERLAVRLGLGDRVQFRGYVAPGELARFYSEASLVAVSSIWPEPFGMVGPEAMRHGLPVVAFDAGGIAEWLKDGVNGFLVPWGDTNAYAARIETLLRDKELAREMGVRGRERVTRIYSPEGQVGILEDVLFNITNKEQSSNESLSVLTLDGHCQ